MGFTAERANGGRRDPAADRPLLGQDRDAALLQGTDRPPLGCALSTSCATEHYAPQKDPSLHMA
eukprot:80828-Pleurochrysis_carterae.AAC.1